MEKEEFSRQHIDPSKLPSAAVAKWSESTLDEGYVPFPKRLVRCLPAIFEGSNAAEELAVILSIVDYKRPRLSRHPSLAYLAYLAGMEEGRYQALLNSLESKGLIAVNGDSVALEISIDGLLEKISKETRR